MTTENRKLNNGIESEEKFAEIPKKVKAAAAVLALIAAVLVAFTLIRSVAVLGTVRFDDGPAGDLYQTFDDLESLNKGWLMVHENGSVEPVTLPLEYRAEGEDRITLRLINPSENLGDQALFFDNNRQGVRVSTNHGLLYTANTSPLTSQLHFTDYQIISLPDKGHIEYISIEFSEPVNGVFYLPEIKTGSESEARYRILYTEWSTLFILIIFVTVGLAILATTIYMHAHREIDRRLYSLLLFMLLATLWGFTSSYLPVLTRIPQEIVGLVCYLSFLSLPIPMAFFVGKSLVHENRLIMGFGIVGIVNLLAQCILSFMGLIQLQKSFYVAYAIVAVGIVIGFVALFKQTRDYPENREYKWVFYGMTIFMVFVIMTMAIYLTGSETTHYVNCLLVGILLFLVALLISVISHYNDMEIAREKEATEMRLYEKFSNYDELTGLKNRRAFERHLESIEASYPKDRDAVLIMMDVNGLKHTNDTFGHAAGDDLIVSAARAVEAAYGDKGACYRIGGDEFVVILEDYLLELSILDDKLEKAIALKNETSRWKLSIARGCSHLLHGSRKQISISDWKQEADVLMYKDKIANTTAHSRNRERDLQRIIDCIVSTIEARDIYTAHHSDRVQEISLCIGDHLGLSNATRESLAISAHLHDIGKIGIPDSVLLKEGKLTDDEFEIIKTHPQIGADIISKAPGMSDISRVVLHHHESYDGKGYPAGLSKEDIPLEARIIAIADSIDAMTSRRCYREPMSIDACREEIARLSGIKYDPALVKIAMDNWNEIQTIILLHPKRLLPAQ